MTSLPPASHDNDWDTPLNELHTLFTRRAHMIAGWTAVRHGQLLRRSTVLAAPLPW